MAEGLNSLEGKWCTVRGLASRPELNGSTVHAISYDAAKGRYNVQLQSGSTISLKSENLERSPTQPASPSVTTPSNSTNKGTSPPGNKQDVSWQTVVVVALGAWWVYTTFFGGGGTSGGSSDAEYHGAEDTGYANGEVREVTTQPQFQGVLAQHRDDTGLPVVVDFFSQSCGPCHMIAPAFRSLAKEYANRAVFIKVDVNANYQTSSSCGVRSMPTFQFYLNGKLVAQFAGADQNGLRHHTKTVVSRAEAQGTYVGLELTEAVIKDFYSKHPPGKLATPAGTAAKYRGKCAKLMRLLKSKYGEAPVPVPKAASQSAASADDADPDSTGESVRGLADASIVELRQELSRRLMDATADVFGGTEGPSGATETLVVIGGGPAGLSAAIYAARAGLSPLVIGPSLGGQLLGKGVDVENYPGSAGGATGRSIVAEMRYQAQSFKCRMLDDSVVAVDLASHPFRLILNGTNGGTNGAAGAAVLAHSVVIASGADSRWLGVPGEWEYRGGGVSSCATCDGFLFRDVAVVVVGGGDTAMEDALVLARTSSRVTVVHRRGEFRASRILAERVLSHPRIDVKWNSTVSEFGGRNDGDRPRLTHVMVNTPAGPEKLSVEAAFVAIGHDPNTKLLEGQLKMDEQGYVEIDGRTSKTSVPGVFAAGDVADRVYRQAVTSAGSGAMAALDAERWLSENGLGI